MSYTERHLLGRGIVREYPDGTRWVGRYRLKHCERCRGKGTLKVWKRWWKIRIPGRVKCPACGGCGSASYFSGIPVPKAPWQK